MITEEYLSNFEKEISGLYLSGKIRGPVHLRNGNETQLIKIFKDITSDDYVFSTWANHLHALLKGIPSDRVKARILEGESMAMNFPEYRFYTSAIVGGICPIATGASWAIKHANTDNKVWVFLGDMSFLTGIAQESIRYSINYDLPIQWVVEDNDISVSTPTRKTWKCDLDKMIKQLQEDTDKIIHYKYTSTYPHSGVGTFVSF